MTDILRPVAELSILFPGMLLSYLPVKQYLRLRPGRVFSLAAGLSALLCLGGGCFCFFFQVKTLWLLFFSALAAGFLYVNTLHVTRWKSISVFLAVCGVFSCLGNLAKALDVVLMPGSSDPWLSFGAASFYCLICWCFTLIAAHPATHAARDLLEENAFAQTWYVFWILPLLFIGLNLFIIPADPDILFQGRLLSIYVTVSIVLLILLLLFYALFYLMAASLNRNDRLRRENQFLSMQQAQYDNLRAAIEETREARHDMRHRFQMLADLAERKNWEQLKEHLATACADLPNTDLGLCSNLAVDGVASRYSLLFQKNKIPFSIELDLPLTLPVPEMDLCLVLSNLLENALEASLRTSEARRRICVQAYLHSKTVVLLTVENAFDTTVREKDGVFLSSKRHGDGVGIQSVRHIAEKCGGYSRFSYENGVFCANVMLRGF